MKIAKNLLAITLFFIAIIISSCKKKDVIIDDNKTNCRIARIITGGNEVLLFYNNDWKLSGESYGGTNVTFTYSGDTILAALDNNAGKRTIVLNAAGLARYVKYNYIDGSSDSTIYEYNGEELNRKIVFEASGFTDTTTYQWNNHNLVSETNSGLTVSYDYYTDKLYQAGDAGNQLSLGYVFIRNKNLLKTIDDGTRVTSFTYEFRNDGKISGYSISTGLDVKFEYECN